MCGIIGAIGKHIDHNFLLDMFLATESRGKDATGFWSPATGIVKDPSPVSEFIVREAETFHKAVTESNVFIGHCRYATHGEPQFNYNNHPLESENWILVHNGVVDIVDIEDYRYVSDTDTENILAYIETYGLVPALKQVSRGAALIMYNKNEENTLYLWKTATQPMLFAYDQTNETIYVCSGDTYIRDSIVNISVFEERLGGLFSMTNRSIKLTDPKARDLWKIEYKEDQLHATLVEDNLPIVAYARNNKYNDYNHSWAWTYGTNYDWEDDTAFLDIGTGKYRPGVLSGKTDSTQDVKERAKKKVEEYAERRKKWDKKNETSPAYNPHQTTKSVVKDTPTFVEGDIVALKRDPSGTDAIYSLGTQGQILSLKKGHIFCVDRILDNGRYTVQDIKCTYYTIPGHLLKHTECPNCYGVVFDAMSTLCTKDCMYSLPCEDLTNNQPLDDELPQCVGTYEEDNEVCIECWFLTSCLRLCAELDYEDDVIDAEYKEVNSEEASSCAG